MDPTIVVIGFVVLLAALLYYMYKDHGRRRAEAEPKAKKEPDVVKVRDYEAQLEAEKKETKKPEPQPEPKAEAEAEPKPEPKMKPEPAPREAPTIEAAEEGLESLSGVGEKYRALLKAAGVETLQALAKWDAEDLFEKLIEVNESQKVVKRPPPLSTVEDWVKRAGERTG